MLHAARRFVTIVEEGREVSPRELIALLDHLESECASLPERFDDRDLPDPEIPDYDERRRKAAVVCPYLGLTADGMDGIDDVADIYGDLLEVLERLRCNGEDDAMWYYKLSYRSHLRSHIRSLRRQLVAG